MNHAPADDHHGHGAVGPLIDEAALLLTAVEDKLQAWQATEGRAAGAPAEPPRPCPECGTVPGAACTGCPVCRLVAAVRGERPEVTARMVDGALTIVRALRTLLPDPAGGTAGPAADPATPGRTDPPQAPAAPASDPPADPPSAGPVPPPRPGPTPRAGSMPRAGSTPRPGPRPPTRAAAGLQRIDIT